MRQRRTSDRATDQRFRPDHDSGVAKAWTLYNERHWPMRRIAETLGIAPDTASRWVREAREQNAIKETLDPDTVAASSVEKLNRWSEQLEAGIEMGEVELLPGTRELRALNESLRRVVGADAALRVQVTATAPAPEKGRVNVALLQEMDAEQQHEQAHDFDPASPDICDDDACPLLAQARSDVATRWAAEEASA